MCIHIYIYIFLLRAIFRPPREGRREERGSHDLSLLILMKRAPFLPCGRGSYCSGGKRNKKYYHHHYYYYCDCYYQYYYCYCYDYYCYCYDYVYYYVYVYVMLLLSSLLVLLSLMFIIYYCGRREALEGRGGITYNTMNTEIITIFIL